MAEPYLTLRAAALASLAVVGLTGCQSGAGGSTATRLVGAHQVALVVPAEWKTDVEHNSFCPPFVPKTVQFFDVNGPLASCAGPIGASWPAEDSVSIYTQPPRMQTPQGEPSGMIHGLAYYISDSRQSGPGVAMTLAVPGADVSFLIGAADRATATALFSTIHFVPGGTQLR